MKLLIRDIREKGLVSHIGDIRVFGMYSITRVI